MSKNMQKKREDKNNRGNYFVISFTILKFIHIILE